jgi:hypothetical protein
VLEANEPLVRPAAHIPPGFHNPVAVRIALSTAALAALLTWFPFLNLGFLVWWIAAGFYAAYRYRRRTGQLLSVRDGARMGWITGVLTFAIMIILITLNLVPLAFQSGDLGALYEEQLRSMPVQGRDMEQVLRMLRSPAGLAFFITLSILTIFAAISALCTAGGALGAKITGKD